MAKEPFRKALIYDDNCPLCKAYSAAFVSSGFLTKENRVPFSRVRSGAPGTGDSFTGIDWQRARHEIPLIDLESGEVQYGVDALVDVLSQRIHFLKKIMRLKWAGTFIAVLYRFISYNRKVIAANYQPVRSAFDCSPEYSFFWRCILIVVSWFFSFLFTTLAAAQVNGGFGLDPNAAFFVLVLMPLPPAIYKDKKFMADLYAHSGITYMITSLLLFLVISFKNIFHLPQLPCQLLFGAVAYVLIRQVVQRVRFMKLM